MNFTKWLVRRKDSLPTPDRLLLIKLAWAAGIEEGELRAQGKLPKKLMDEFLQALVSSGQVRVCVASVVAPVRT